MSVTGVPTPHIRRLRGYSFDPSLSVQLDTALVNEAVFKVRWEKDLQVGPIGEYLEVVDFDPPSNCFYQPVDLNDSYILAQDGLVPSESNPKFHQQMVYAVAMATIQNFEKALGRRALWSSFHEGKDSSFIQRLRIYPHGLRQANAYYSPIKKALLFGYFPASSGAPGDHVPNGVVFTCLSHDIIAHETTHALLDGMHRRFIEDNQRDNLAFHEAFADIALFQHFSFPEVLRQQIAKTRGDLASQSLLGQLAQQFGRAIGQYGALRDAIGEFDVNENKWKAHVPDPKEYQEVLEPHARGAILVAAVFDAFLSIYKCRVADLLRIASNGTGILRPGELHPDLVNRLAHEAAKSAQHVLTMCIRALDYCPPVDITFGDYLRAIITADSDVYGDDRLGYRIAFIEAFRRRGIYPRNIRNLSEESLCWSSVSEEDQQVIFNFITSRLRFFVHHLGYLDEFPSLDELARFPVVEIEKLKNILIPNRERAWNSLAEQPKAKLWENLFAHEKFLYGFIQRPYPANKSWSELEKVDKVRAEMVIWQTMFEREKIFTLTRAAQEALHEWLAVFKADAEPNEVARFEELTGLYFIKTPERDLTLKGISEYKGRYNFEVHSFRSTQRVGPNDSPVSRVIVTITQQRTSDHNGPDPGYPAYPFRGGCTIVFDLQTLKLKYVVKKLIDNSDQRMTRQDEYRSEGIGASLVATYFGKTDQNFAEPFALLHSEF